MLQQELHAGHEAKVAALNGEVRALHYCCCFLCLSTSCVCPANVPTSVESLLWAVLAIDKAISAF